jgi:CubicO group peptidase (beta-lactamase class C family)
MTKISTWLVALAAGVGLVAAIVTGVTTYTVLTTVLTTVPLYSAAESVPASRSTSAAGWTDAIAQGEQSIRASMLAQNLPGLSVAVGIGSEIVWAEGFGWADLERKVPVTPETRMKIGTASTVLSSAAVGPMLQEGRLDLDEPIQRHVPDFPVKPWPVTLRQVMGHVAGLRSDGGDEGPFRSTHCERTLDGLQLFADGSLRFEPGTAYRFSSYGWILVSAAVEAAAGEPFFTVMEKRVFAPLGMHHTVPDAETVEQRAMTYFPRMGDPRYGSDGGPRTTDYSCYAGGAAFLSTPSDLVRFGMGITRVAVLEPATVQLLQTPHRVSGGETDYGLGWELHRAPADPVGDGESELKFKRPGGQCPQGPFCVTVVTGLKPRAQSPGPASGDCYPITRAIASLFTSIFIFCFAFTM